MDRAYRRAATGLGVLLLLGALAAPAAARSPTITFYFGLERPEAKARKAFAAATSPGSASYRHFLSARQAARRYGASPRTIRAFKRGARAYGFRARIDRSGVFARLTGSVKRFERVFRVRLRSQFDNDVFATTWWVRGNRPLRIPRNLRPLVREQMAGFSRSTKMPRRAASAAAPPQPGNLGTWTTGCEAARATGSYSFAQVRSAYGVDALGSGAGASVAIFNSGEGIPQADIRLGAFCFGLPSLRPRILLSDGQARPFGPGSEEPELDVAMVRGMAPGLSSLILTQTWLDPEFWFLGPAQTFGARRLPDTLSISYGDCERDVRGRRGTAALRGGARLFDALLVRLGLVGVGTFVATGDFGSTCNGDPVRGIAWPASSPWATAVGGTRLVLDAANARGDEVVWNDLEWLSPDNGAGAGGGGLSTASGRPPWQRGLALSGRRRAAPDVSAHASLLPGWPVALGRNWIEVGGTSAASPLLASAFAVISARERAAGRPPLGSVNGLLYWLQANAPASIFDIVSGTNKYDARVRGISAQPGYDMASGVGVPRFDRVAAVLPPPAP
jgi:subtilase family serine protease